MSIKQSISNFIYSITPRYCPKCGVKMENKKRYFSWKESDIVKRCPECGSYIMKRQLYEDRSIKTYPHKTRVTK